MNNGANIITDLDGVQIVLINDIYFQSRRGINWKTIEQYLKRYIGECFETLESAEKIYVGSDFPDEFSHSNDTRGLKGANIKAKANAISVIGKLIQIATNRVEYPDFNSKHGSKAKLGWYRYDTRFGIPVYNDMGIVERYNIFLSRILVRRNEDGRLFLYDLVRTKKETSKPFEQFAIR